MCRVMCIYPLNPNKILTLTVTHFSQLSKHCLSPLTRPPKTPQKPPKCPNNPKLNERCSSATTSSVFYAAHSLLRRPTPRLNHSRLIKLLLSMTSSMQSSPATISAPCPLTLLDSSSNSPMTTRPTPPTESTPSCSTASTPSLCMNPKTTRTRLLG